MELFYVWYSKWYKDVWFWFWRDGSWLPKQGYVPTNVPWAKVDESSEKIALQALERKPFVLAIFHHWLRYAKIVLRVMTSWEKNSPRIGLATCLGKEPSGSFNVLNCWICEQCKNHIRVKENQHQILEPAGTFWGLEINSMDWLWVVPHTMTLVKAVEAKLYVRPIDYIILGIGKTHTCNSEVSLTKQSLIFRRRQRKWKTKHELCSSLSLSHTGNYPTNQRGKSQQIAFYCDEYWRVIF